MKVPLGTFFNFCAKHPSLLRALCSFETGEVSEREVLSAISDYAEEGDELDETVLSRLQELQILIPVEIGGERFHVAPQVAALISYLLSEAKPATPEMIEGYIEAIAGRTRDLERATRETDSVVAGLALTGMADILRRIYRDIEETQAAILREVIAFRIAIVPVKDKFKRIVYWMETFVQPMVEIIRVGGAMEAVFVQLEHAVKRSALEAIASDPEAILRVIRMAQTVRRYGWRVFDQCLREIQPLYRSLLRSSHIAAGAAIALSRLRENGLSRWGDTEIIAISTLRFHNLFTEHSLATAVRRTVHHTPIPPPQVDADGEGDEPPAQIRRRWLQEIGHKVHSDLPIEDLMEYLLSRSPDMTVQDALAGFTATLFDRKLDSAFTNKPEKTYCLKNARLHASPVHVSKRK